MLSDENHKRYSRQIILPEVGEKGQEKLTAAKVLMIGAGGLGSPVCYYLAAAGVGTIGIVDMDVIDLSNLQRQILHSTDGLGKPKVESAKERLIALNPNIKINPYNQKIEAHNVIELIEQYDIVVNGVDNFTARFLLNDACVFAKKPLVEAGVLRWEGMIMTIVPDVGPCYRCVYPEPPPTGAVPTAQEAGVIGVIAGTMGVLQAAEVIKFILGAGKGLVGRLLTFDALYGTFNEVHIKKNSQCGVCGESPNENILLNYINR